MFNKTLQDKAVTLSFLASSGQRILCSVVSLQHHKLCFFPPLAAKEKKRGWHQNNSLQLIEMRTENNLIPGRSTTLNVING